MQTIIIDFSKVFAIVSMNPVSSGFEEWTYMSFVTRFIWPKERNVTGRNRYMHVINLAIM